MKNFESFAATDQPATAFGRSASRPTYESPDSPSRTPTGVPFNPAATATEVAHQPARAEIHKHDISADVSDEAREILRHFPEGEPPARMLLPWGLASVVVLLVAFVAAISAMMAIFVNIEAGIMTAGLGLMLAIVANPVLWAAIFRVREHRNADRAAPSPRP